MELEERLRRSKMELAGNHDGVFRRVLAAVDPAESLPSEEIPESRRGALYYRVVGDREISLYPLITGTVRLVVGEVGNDSYDDAWCYAGVPSGLLAASCWDGQGDPPDGWFRNISTDRRRPGGDPDSEYVRAP